MLCKLFKFVTKLKKTLFDLLIKKAFIILNNNYHYSGWNNYLQTTIIIFEDVDVKQIVLHRPPLPTPKLTLKNS